MKRTGKNMHSGFNRIRINNYKGSSMPIVMLIMLIVLMVGGAVAYAAVQIFTIVRNEEHNQMTYIAAESAIERTISNLDKYLTNENFAVDRGIAFSSETQFINDIIDELNDGDPQIANSFNIPVYADSSLNSADAAISFSWDGLTYTRTGNKLKFPMQVTASASMENGKFRSYGRKAVGVKEYEVWIYEPFKLNAAVYTLGDLVVKGIGTSTITDDVYVFGTGLDKPNRMEQYYMGGVCVVDSAILHINQGSVYTRNLVRVGTFDETGSNKCAVVVDHDVVADGIQAFGINDAIVVIRDAYTFDDIEMNGANSYIAINGNYFGLNFGDQSFHDTSSAVINTSPRYAAGTVNEFTQSRIVINGYTFVNGSTFKMEVDEGRAGHKLENVALAWEGNQPVYLAEDCDNTPDYISVLTSSSHGERNGFSVLLGNVGWDNNKNLITDWTTWDDWISEIHGKALGQGRKSYPISVPEKIKGFCHYAMAANNKLYPADVDNIELPSHNTIECAVAEDVDGLDRYQLDPYIKGNWYDDTATDTGIPAGLQEMLGILEGHVSVFARKEYPEALGDEINYNFTKFGSTTEFLRIRDLLDDIDESDWDCVIKFGDDGIDNYLTPVNLVDFIKDNYSDPEDYFMIINLDPDRELVIDIDPDTGTGTVNGIIFTMGKVSIKNGATVNGTIIAAGRGYDPGSKVKGSAADSFYYDHDGEASTPDIKMTRLPRIVENTNISNFKSWDYAALIMQDGGNVHFPGRDALFNKFDEVHGGIEFKEILDDIF